MDFFRRRRISLKKESKSFDLLSFFWRRLPDGAFAPIGSPIPPYGSNKKSTPYGVLFLLEAPPGIGPGNKGFADLCLTAWLRRRIDLFIITKAPDFVKGFLLFFKNVF